MNNQEIDQFIVKRAVEIANGMDDLSSKGSVTDTLLTVIASNVQTMNMLVAELVKRLPEPGTKSTEERP